VFGIFRRSSDLLGYRGSVLERLRAMAKDELAGLNGAAVERETAVLRLRLAHEQQLALLLADVGTLSALSVVQGLDWLLLARIPVQIPDRVAEEARQTPELPGARAISDWIERNVVSGSVSIVRTDPGYDRRQQFAAWVAGGIDPGRRPHSIQLGEAAVLDLVTSLEGRRGGNRKAVILVDERNARRALAEEPDIEIFSTRAFFRVLADNYVQNASDASWRLVLDVIQRMDPLVEVERVRMP
jgi:hypothetical protein